MTTVTAVMTTTAVQPRAAQWPTLGCGLRRGCSGFRGASHRRGCWEAEGDGALVQLPVLGEAGLAEEALGAGDALDRIRDVGVLVPLMADEGVRTSQHLAAPWVVTHGGPSTPATPWLQRLSARV